MDSKIDASSFGWPSQAITQSKEASEIQLKQAAERRSQKAAAERKAQEAELTARKKKLTEVVEPLKLDKVLSTKESDRANNGGSTASNVAQDQKAPIINLTV